MRNRVYVGTRTMGQGTLTLEGAVRSDFCTFDEAGFTNNARVQSFIIEEAGNFEIVKGIYNNTGLKPTLTRASVRISKINNVVGTAKMSLGGAATVRMIAAAEDLLAMSGAANIKGYGAVADGITVNTTAIQNALNENAAIYVPDEIFLTGRLIVPATVKLIFGPGTLKATGVLSAFQDFIDVTASPGLTIRDVSIDVNTTAFATNGSIAFVGSSNIHLDRVKFINGGRFCVQIIGGSKITVEDCDMPNFVQSAINASGSASGLKIINNNIPGAAITAGSTIDIGVCIDVQTSGNNIVGSLLGWPISYQNVTRGHIKNNLIRDSQGEGLVAGNGSTDIEVSGNLVTWSDTAISTDFGMSFGGADPAKISKRINVHSNTIVGAHKSGIAFYDYIADSQAVSNLVIDCNSGNIDPNGNGIELASAAASACTNNLVANNTIRNATAAGHMRYAVAEYLGADHNRFVNNVIEGMVTADVLIAGANTTNLPLGGVAVTNNNTLGATVYLPWMIGFSGNQPLYASSTKLLFNPSIGNLATVSFNGLTITANGANTLNIAPGKTLTASNTVALSGTDGSTVAFGAGGTIAYQGAITTAYFVANVIDTDVTLAANSDTRLATQKAAPSRRSTKTRRAALRC